MEEGSLRCDANVSVRPRGQTALGTKAEVKNLNSFRFLQKALEYEIERQIEIVERRRRASSRKRGLWDAAAGHTVSMRSKEEAHDYRYFPEPDLPPLSVDAARVDAHPRRRCRSCPRRGGGASSIEYALPEYDAAQLTQSRALADYFEAAVAAGAPPKAASNWIMGEHRADSRSAASNRRRRFTRRCWPAWSLVENGTISGSIAKDVFEKMYRDRAGRRTRSSRPRVWRRSTTKRRSRARRRGARDATRRRRAVSRRQSDCVRFPGRPGDEGGGGKANPKRVNELLKRVLELAGQADGRPGSHRQPTHPRVVY